MAREAFNDWTKARNDAGLFLCTGLDPDDELIPEGVSLRNFLTDTIDATAEFSAGFKPNVAFYEGRRRVENEVTTGQDVYAAIVSYIHERYPDHPVIGDAKRADIGNTNRPYADEFFDWFDVDAITTNPYFGNALSPYFERKDRGVIVMCRTSNPEAARMQDVLVQANPPILGREWVPYYLYVANEAVQEWNGNGNLGLLMGATAPEPAQLIRQVAPDVFGLSPGIGDQGAEILSAVRGVWTPSGSCFFNVSRGVAAAWKKGLFQVDDPSKYVEAAAKAAKYYDMGLRTAVTEVRQERGLVE